MKPAPLLSVALFGLLLSASMTATQAQETLALCLSEAADHSPVYATQTFPASAAEWMAVFRVPKGKYQKLTMRWMALDAGKTGIGNDIVLPRCGGGSTRRALP